MLAQRFSPSDPRTATPTLDPSIQEAEDAATELAKRYHLILMDDDDHTYQYVVHMLGQIFGYAREKAFAIASMVDGSGQAVVETDAYDVVKHHQDAIHAFGPDPRVPRCQGSMSATIEEAP